MKKTVADIKADWRWGTPEGSREFDRMIDRSMSFRETLEWLEEVETLSLRVAASGGASGAGALEKLKR